MNDNFDYDIETNDMFNDPGTQTWDYQYIDDYNAYPNIDTLETNKEPIYNYPNLESVQKNPNYMYINDFNITSDANLSNVNTPIKFDNIQSNMDLSGVDSNWNQDNPLNFPTLNNLNPFNTMEYRTNNLEADKNIPSEYILQKTPAEYDPNLQIDQKEILTPVANSNLPYGNSIFAFNQATTPQQKLTEQQLYNDYGMYDTNKYSGALSDSNGNVTFFPINNQNTNNKNNKQLQTAQNTVNGSNTNNLLSQNLNLANQLRLQQLTLAKQMQNNQLSYLKQHDSLMTSLQNQTLAQQKAIANQQLQAQLNQFNKNYALQKMQFEWQKAYQNTLLNQQQEEYQHQKDVRNRITNQFLGR